MALLDVNVILRFITKDNPDHSPRAYAFSLRGLKLTHKTTHLRALDLFVAHRQLSFADALNVAHLERLKVTEIVSFDRGYDRVPGVTRQEP
jgi:predicted nucleic acid-binding protein